MTKKGELNIFTISIYDGYVSYEYPLEISNEYSIDEISTIIYKSFNLSKRNGVKKSIKQI
jgi:hypothetical protein